MDDLDLVLAEDSFFPLASPIVLRDADRSERAAGWALVYEARDPFGEARTTRVVIEDMREQRFFRRVRRFLARFDVDASRYRVRPPADDLS